MPKAKVIYDGNCPVCTTYMRLVKNKLGSEKVEYITSSETATDFEYTSLAGKSYFGTQAIAAMAKDFPAIKDYAWYLPEKYRTVGLQMQYKVGSVIRKAVGIVKKGCNCGGKKH